MPRHNLSYNELIEAEKLHWKALAGRAQEIWRWSGAIGTARFRRRMEFLRQGAVPGKRFLEVGCGIGLLTGHLAATGADITAIDLSPDLLATARSNVRGVTFIEGDAVHSPFHNDSFDGIVGCSVLHHLNVPAALKEFFRILKPGASVRFTEPNYMNPHVVLERKVPWLRDRLGVTRFETAFFRGPVARLFRASGFEAVRAKPFDFLYPLFPDSALATLRGIEKAAEATPLIREFSGSLMLEARKPVR